MATAGDVNGDGFSDVIVGAYCLRQRPGGRGAGVRLPRLGGGALASTAAWTAESDQAGAQFGYSVATAGDVNGDGFSDVIVGALRYDNGQNERGAGVRLPRLGAGLATSPAWTAEANSSSRSSATRWRPQGT